MTEIALHRIQSNTLAIASMPIAAVRCMTLLRTADFSLREAADVIADDAVLAARVFSVSNSAAFGGIGRIRNLVQAVTRLGADQLRIVLFEATAAGIFTSNDERIRDACARLWNHSRAVAMTARHLGVVVGVSDPGEAYLAGLLHDLGKPIVAAMLLQTENRLFEDRTNIWLEPETWLEIIQLANRTVGVAVARRWNLPDPITEAMEECIGYRTPGAAIINCVRLANALAKEQGIYVGKFDSNEIDQIIGDGQQMLGLDDVELTGLRTELTDAHGRRGTVSGSH